jgi:hypothetical protein
MLQPRRRHGRRQTPRARAQHRRQMTAAGLYSWIASPRCAVRIYCLTLRAPVPRSLRARGAEMHRFSLCASRASAFISSARPVPKISKTRTTWPLPACSHVYKLPRSSSIRERAPNARVPNAQLSFHQSRLPQVCSALAPRAASADVQRLITSRGRSCF